MFYDEFMDELNWDFAFDKVGDPETELELRED